MGPETNSGITNEIALPSILSEGRLFSDISMVGGPYFQLKKRFHQFLC